jgi:hypothetical protein
MSEEQPYTPESWLAEVNQLMLKQYCITLEDGGCSKEDELRYAQQALEGAENGSPICETPQEFVDWYGEKYDLDRGTDWMTYRD